jgi:hypothetical protein
MEEEFYGASGTDPRSIAGMGVLNSLSGGRGDLVQQYVNEAVPLPKKADPYVAALKFFIEMGKQASQPGATVLGSITGSMGAPVDYLEAKALERQKAEQARSALGLQIAPSLKPGPGAGKITYRPATAAELAQYGAASGQMGSDGKFYDLSKTASTTANDLKPFAIIDPTKLADIQRIVPTASVDVFGNVLLTDAESRQPGVRQYIGQKVTPDKDGAGAAKYADDGTGTIRYTENPPAGKKIGDAVFGGIDLSGYTENQIKLGDQLRDDLTKALGDFNDINSSMKDINSFYTLATTEANPISDYSLAVQYAKIIDPGTAAREGEVAAIASAGSLTGAAKAQIINMIFGNGKLSPRMRASIFNNSVKIYESKLPNALSTIKRYKTVANKQKEGLFELVGLNVDVDETGKVLYRGVGGDPAVDTNNYHMIDLSNIAEDPLDLNPTAINFPDDFTFEGFTERALRSMLELPPGSLDSQTLDKIDAALDAL